MKIRNAMGGVLLLISSLVFADDIYLGQPGYGGSGCAQGTVSATLSPDYKQLSILFDQYVVEAQGGTTIARKNCNVTIPVHVPQGLSVSVLQADYRGYNGLPRGANSQLTAEYFFAGVAGPKTSRMFYGGLDEEYLVRHNLLASAIVWSGCGQDVNLRINSAMRVRTNAAGEQALSTVDSLDLAAGMLYHLQWRHCGG